VSTQKRRDLSLPDGWKPTHHSTVQVLESDTLRPQELHVAGAWRCISPAPGDGWWLQPSDEAARWWLQRYGTRAGAASGMVNVHRQRLVPSWLQLTVPGT
jgi:hypothetical protein